MPHGSGSSAEPLSSGGKQVEFRSDRFSMGGLFRQTALCFFDPARVAKLVDAPGLGPDASNGVGVRVPPRAPVVTVLAAQVNYFGEA